MVKYANIWEPADIAVMNIFSAYRKQSALPISDRALARAIRVSPPRVADLFNHRHGSPSLREFIALCTVFGLSPSKVLDKALSNISETSSTQADKPALSPEERANIAITEFKKGSLDIAADADPNKEIEMNGDAGDF